MLSNKYVLDWEKDGCQTQWDKTDCNFIASLSAQIVLSIKIFVNVFFMLFMQRYFILQKIEGKNSSISS